MRKLPLDISTFSELIQSGYLYIDKTEYAYKLITGGRRFFLSRPRRFGKSLLVSTLKEILTANKSLFDGLWIGNSDYQWQEYVVINLDFSKLASTDVATFKNRLWHALKSIAEYYQIQINTPEDAPDLMLEKLVFTLHQRFGRVAILVDEYDSPILKTLHDETLAKEIRNTIQHIFTVIKGLDAQVQFAFITGVSSFAKAGLFSGINNLQMLTLNKHFAGICGYTDSEVDHYLSEHLHAWVEKNNEPFEALRQRIKTWYNGYHFGYDVPAVYNPFSLMHAINAQEFNNFWFQSGTPTFLVDILKKNPSQLDLNSLHASQDFLGVFDVGNIPAVSLMFQAGYLTITDYDPEAELFTLDYPNLEVKKSFQKYLLEVFAHIEPMNAAKLSAELYQALNKQDIEKTIEILRQLFAHVPYQLHVKVERYYHSLFMMICIGAGIKAQSEYSTSHARIDLVLEFAKIIYVIEVKLNDTAENALKQIEERRYYERFIHEQKKIILLGLAFERESSEFDITYAIKELE